MTDTTVYECLDCGSENQWAQSISAQPYCGGCKGENLEPLITRSLTREQWREKLTDFDEFERWCYWCRARSPLAGQLDHTGTCPCAETQEEE